MKVKEHMDAWCKHIIAPLNTTIARPRRLFRFTSIAGNHRRIAATELLKFGCPSAGVEKGNETFATGASTLMYNLPDVQARTVGSLDNTRGDTKLEQQPVDMLHLTQSAMSRLTFRQIMDNVELHPALSSAISLIDMATIRQMEGHENEPEDFPGKPWTLIATLEIYNPENGQIASPLVKNIALADIVDAIFHHIISTDIHKEMSSLEDKKTRRHWKNAIAMAMHGERVITLLTQVDEALKEQVIFYNSIEPRKQKQQKAKATKVIKDTPPKKKQKGQAPMQQFYAEAIAVKVAADVTRGAIEEHASQNKVGITTNNFYAMVCADKEAVIMCLEGVLSREFTLKEVIHYSSTKPNMLAEYNQYHILRTCVLQHLSELKLTIDGQVVVGLTSLLENVMFKEEPYTKLLW